MTVTARPGRADAPGARVQRATATSTAPATSGSIIPQHLRRLGSPPPAGRNAQSRVGSRRARFRDVPSGSPARMFGKREQPPNQNEWAVLRRTCLQGRTAKSSLNTCSPAAMVIQTDDLKGARSTFLEGRPSLQPPCRQPFPPARRGSSLGALALALRSTRSACGRTCLQIRP